MLGLGAVHYPDHAGSVKQLTKHAFYWLHAIALALRAFRR